MFTTLYPFRVLSLLKGVIATSMMSPQQQLNRILPKTVKLNVQEEVALFGMALFKKMNILFE